MAAGRLHVDDVALVDAIVEVIRPHAGRGAVGGGHPLNRYAVIVVPGPVREAVATNDGLGLSRRAQLEGEVLSRYEFRKRLSIVRDEID